MGEYLEAELTILVDHRFRLAVVRSQMLGKEILVDQHFLQQVAHLLAAAAARVHGQEALAGGGEVFERMGHCELLIVSQG